MVSPSHTSPVERKLSDPQLGTVHGSALNIVRIPNRPSPTLRRAANIPQLRLPIWRVPKPLRKIVHTLGWPLRKRARYGEFGGSFVYPMGDDHVSLGFVVGLEYADVELSAHDLLQEFKTHKLVRKLLDGGERVAWGAKTITEGGLNSLPSRLNAPGLLLVGEGAGLVNVPRLKGIHYAIESGRLAAEAAFAALQRGEVAGRRGALDTYDAALRESYLWKDLDEVRNMRTPNWKAPA